MRRRGREAEGGGLLMRISDTASSLRVRFNAEKSMFLGDGAGVIVTPYTAPSRCVGLQFGLQALWRNNHTSPIFACCRQCLLSGYSQGWHPDAQSWLVGNRNGEEFSIGNSRGYRLGVGHCVG